MSKWGEKLAHGAARQQRGAKLPTPMLDADSIVKAHRVAERGAEDGARNVPDSSASSFSEAETEVHQVIEDALEEASRILTASTKDFPNVGREYVGIEQEAASIRNRANAEFEKLRQTSLPEIREFIEVERRALRQLKAFRQIHGFVRDGKVSEVISVVALLGFLFLIELGLTAIFIGQYSGGFGGGIVSALLVTGTAVFSGFIAGNFYKALGFKTYGIMRKFLIFLSLAMLFVAGLSSALYAAHFRLILEAGGFTDEQQAASVLNSIIYNTWQFVDVKNSLLAFAVAVGAYIISAYKGYTFHDPYWNYGPEQKRYNLAFDKLEARRKTYLEDLKSTYEAACLNPIDEIRKRIRSEWGLVEAYSEQAKNVSRKRSAMAEQANHCLSRVIGIYRDNNRITRDSDEPKYFSEPLPRFELDIDLEVTNNMTSKRYEDALKHLEITSEKMSEEFALRQSEAGVRLEELAQAVEVEINNAKV